MVKIKRKVEMTLPELIEWAWKNDICLLYTSDAADDYSLV